MPIGLNFVCNVQWRSAMAEMQTQTSLDSLGDVLNSATAATVLTEATDELSHNTLVGHMLNNSAVSVLLRPNHLALA